VKDEFHPFLPQQFLYFYGTHGHGSLRPTSESRLMGVRCPCRLIDDIRAAFGRALVAGLTEGVPELSSER